MSRIPHNKKIESKEEYKIVRRMFFQNHSLSEISKKTNITVRVLRRIRDENRLVDKRKRYHRFVIYFAYSNEISIKDISMICKIRKSSLIKFKREQFIKTKIFKIHNKRMNRSLEKKIISDYQGGMTSKDISLKYGYKTGKTVLDVLDKNHIEKRPSKKYTNYCINYFKKIDSNKKAYILGILATDGYIIKDYKGVAIQLTKSDREILEKISKELGESCTILNIKGNNVIADSKKHKRKDMVRLCCYCPDISLDVKKYGIERNKTHFLKFSNKIPKEYLGSYYRGIVDGDGSLGINKSNNYPWVSISTCSKGFAMSLIENLPDGVGGKYYFIKNKHKGIYDIRISGGKSSIINFLKWIYKDKEDFYLERKYGKIKDIVY